MYRVIDIISYKGSWIQRYPDLADRGEGLLVILNPEDIRAPPLPVLEGQEILIRKLDGSELRLTASGVEAPHGIIGIFFKEAVEGDVSRGSLVDW